MDTQDGIAARPDAAPAAGGGAPDWTPLGPAASFEPGVPRAWKGRGKQLVVVRSADGIFALDNRCPHEGYPLATGSLRDHVLTCCWHNWKFDVRDGRCIVGGENARAYPVRERDGIVEAGLAEPDKDQAAAVWTASLERALSDHDTSRAVRDTLRLLQVGVSSWEVLLHLARYDAEHAEYGSSHVLALAADCGQLAAERPGVLAIQAIAPVLDLCGDVNQRLAPRARNEPLDPGAVPFASALDEAVEAEDAARAEGLVLGAYARGASRERVEEALAAVIARHFTDFGHWLIYLVKSQDLLDHGGSFAAPLHGALAFGLAQATREDTLPYLRPYFDRWERGGAALGGIDDLRGAVLDGTIDEALSALRGALAAGTPAWQIGGELVVAAADRMLRFDDALDADPDVAENWFFATHRLTFASAVRQAVVRFGEAPRERLLLQALAFVHSGHGMDAPPDRRMPLDTGDRGAAGAEPSLERVAQRVRARDPRGAVAATAALLRDDAAFPLFERMLRDMCLEVPWVRPGTTAHAIKTALAALEESNVLAADGRVAARLPALAAVRFLASPVQEARLAATVHTSLRFVVDGIVPRKLTQ